MKKIYQKPNLKSIQLLESALLAASINMTGERLEGGTDQALSNKESEHDIWGDNGSSMWK